MAKVTVTDPQNHGEGRNQYTLYRVDVLDKLKGIETSDSTSAQSVRRRYSDFQWLYQRLLVERPGAIVPIIPHKRALSTEARISDDLIKERRANLEAFIQVVVNHPECEGAPSLVAFLTVEAGDAFDQKKKQLEKEVKSATTNAADSETASLTTNQEVNAVGGKIRNLFARTAVAASVMRGKAELERTQDENEVEEVQKYIDGIQENCKSMSSQAQALVRSTFGQADAYRVMGQATFAWAQTHQDKYCSTGTTTDDTVKTLSKISSSCSDIATLANQKSSLEQTKFETKLQELQRNVHACKVALNKRYEHSLTYTTRLSQIQSRQAALGKLQKSGKVQKVPQAQLDLATAEREAHLARNELETVTQRVLREQERIQPSLDKLLVEIFAEFASIQVQYNEKMKASWSNLVPHLKKGDQVAASAATAAVPTANGGAPTAPSEEELLSMLEPAAQTSTTTTTDESKAEEEEAEDLLL